MTTFSPGILIARSIRRARIEGESLSQALYDVTLVDLGDLV